ncbi:MAG: NAD(P)-dependent glycerol-3-phosphate dehydrogenase, partial [Deltaproteobacteria bacterium]|nr:NAD(P)-dependent glycerol-3-phosphate dehydrogenase [Deltaproteobacteria bacterium]
AVVGAGAWGTALSFHLAAKGIEISLWCLEDLVAGQIAGDRENKEYLPGVILPELIRPSTDIEEVVRGHKIVLMAVPSQFTRDLVSNLKQYLSPGVILVSAAKGIENNTLMTMTQVYEDVLGDDLAVHRAVLSGPSFAKEVGRGLPTAVTVACPDREASILIQHVFASPTLRIYSSQDVIGVELGGALKNVIALATGISDGLEMGLNARAALITRGLAEMSRLGVKMGANPLTFSGLAGIGDLVLTCTGDLSRNRTTGVQLGQGMKLADIMKEKKEVVEGVRTARSAVDLAAREGVDVPLTREVFEVLYNGKTPLEALYDLMKRDLKPELDIPILF